MAGVRSEQREAERVEVNTLLLRWICEGSGQPEEELSERFGDLPRWLDGSLMPTMAEAEGFADAMGVPIESLFYWTPSSDVLPFRDLRTHGGGGPAPQSEGLMETIHLCELRQEWYREYARDTGVPEVRHVGCAKADMDPAFVAGMMREKYAFGVHHRRECSDWEDALRLLARNAEAEGVLVMASATVGGDPGRPLDPGEFGGFALPDPLAPVVFVNGAAPGGLTLLALAHELAHVWLGVAGLSDAGAVAGAGAREEEAWCDAVAHQFLMPREALSLELVDGEPLRDCLARLARTFKVGAPVALARLRAMRRIGGDEFERARKAERLRADGPGDGNGGRRYHDPVSAGRRFTGALVSRTLEGKTLYAEAYRLLGDKNPRTIEDLEKVIWAE